MTDQTIPLQSYIAYNNPRAAIEAMESFGYTVVVRDKLELAKTIAHFIGREGEKGLKALAMVHPDRQLILETQPVSMGADGSLEKTSVATTAAVSVPELVLPKQQTDYTPLYTMIIGGIIASALLVSVAVISKK